jgi:hypothetical protein
MAVTLERNLEMVMCRHQGVNPMRKIEFGLPDSLKRYLINFTIEFNAHWFSQKGKKPYEV